VRTLDVACGTGFLTRHLPGEIVGLDQSESMLEEARRQAPNATYVQGDALSLPFEDGAFERVFTAHFYGHLEQAERDRFLAEARRLAPELVVVDSALREDVEPEEWQERVLNDGSRWEVFKRYFEADALARELGAARPSSQAAGSSPSALDAAPDALPLDRLAARRQPGLPSLRRGRLPARVAPGRPAVRGPARLHVRTGARAWSRARSAAPGAAAPAGR
jgi:SAM-dependent methyltransferase